MAMRPWLLAAVVGIAALGALHTPAAQARGYVSISVGGPAHYYGNRHHRPGYAWVPGHWVSTYRGLVWVPGQYVRVHGYRDDRRHDHGGDSDYGTGPFGPNQRVVPRSYYPPGYLSPFEDRRRRGW